MEEILNRILALIVNGQPAVMGDKAVMILDGEETRQVLRAISDYKQARGWE